MLSWVARQGLQCVQVGIIVALPWGTCPAWEGMHGAQARGKYGEFLCSLLDGATPKTKWVWEDNHDKSQGIIKSLPNLSQNLQAPRDILFSVHPTFIDFRSSGFMPNPASPPKPALLPSGYVHHSSSAGYFPSDPLCNVTFSWVDLQDGCPKDRGSVPVSWIDPSNKKDNKPKETPTKPQSKARALSAAFQVKWGQKSYRMAITMLQEHWRGSESYKYFRKNRSA